MVVDVFKVYRILRGWGAAGDRTARIISDTIFLSGELVEGETMKAVSHHFNHPRRSNGGAPQLFVF